MILVLELVFHLLIFLLQVFPLLLHLLLFCFHFILALLLHVFLGFLASVFYLLYLGLNGFSQGLNLRLVFLADRFYLRFHLLAQGLDLLLYLLVELAYFVTYALRGLRSSGRIGCRRRSGGLRRCDGSHGEQREDCRCDIFFHMVSKNYSPVMRTDTRPLELFPLW